MSLHRAALATVSAAVLLLAACGGASEQSLLDSAKDHLAKGDRAAAIVQIKNALQKNGSNAEARYLLGRTLLDNGEPVNAAVELRKARELGLADDRVVPPLARAMLASGDSRKLLEQFAETRLTTPESIADLKTSIATAHAGAGNLESARSVLAEAQQAQPAFAGALLLNARLKATDKDIPGALFLVEEVLSKDAKNTDAWVLKGDLLAGGQKDAAAAIAAWRKAVELDPKLYGAHGAIVEQLLAGGDIAGARAQVDTLKKLAANRVETRFLEAQVAASAQEWQAARDAIENVLKVAPDNPLALQIAGVADYQLKSYTTADTFLSRALKAQPGLVLARQTLAALYLRQNEPAKAVELLKPLVESPQVDGRILALAAEAAKASGDAKGAKALYARAAKAAPDNAGVRAVVALAEAAGGNAAAFTELEQLAAADASARTDLALIRARLQQKDIDGALRAIDALQKKQPDKPIAYQLRGRIALLRNDEKTAVAQFEKAVSLDPKFFPAVASLAALDLRAGRHDAARQRFDELLKADPKNARAMVALAELKARTGAKPEEVVAQVRAAVQAAPGEAAPRVLLVNQLLAQGDTKGALTAARDASAALPNSLPVMDVLGLAQMASGDSQQAISTFRKLASLQAANPQPLLRLADAQMAAKDRDGAVSSLRKALELKPDLLPAQRGLFDHAQAERKPAEALQIARTVQQQRPAEAIGFVLEGDVEAARRAWEPAAAAYRTALAKSKDASDVALRLHRVLLESGKTAVAERQAAGWLAERPKDTLFLFGLGDLATGRKQWAEAEARYREVLKLRPDNALAHNNIAWLLVQQGKPGALAHAERANALLPDRPPLMDTLALALLAEGQGAKALELQKKALERAPDSPQLRLTMARILAKTGDKGRAKDELERLSKLGERFSQQAEVTELLKTL